MILDNQRVLAQGAVGFPSCALVALPSQGKTEHVSKKDLPAAIWSKQPPQNRHLR